MSDPDDMLDTEGLEYSLDICSTNSDFEETQELKYSMDLFTNSSENTDSELSYDDDDELTNLNEHLKPYNYEPSCQLRNFKQ